jgi:hypothetical protein
MDVKWDEVPPPRELVRAHHTLHRLVHAMPVEGVRDMGGMEAWDGLVEGMRMLCVMTSYLGHFDERYAKAYETMLED